MSEAGLRHLLHEFAGLTTKKGASGKGEKSFNVVLHKLASSVDILYDSYHTQKIEFEPPDVFNTWEIVSPVNQLFGFMLNFLHKISILGEP